MRRHVGLLLFLGVAVAVLLYAGPDEVVGAIMRALGRKEEANRQQLLPHVRAELDGLRAELSDEYGLQTFIGQTRRTTSQQATAQRSGNSDTAQSWHLLDRAVDLYVIDPHSGQPDLDGKLVSAYLLMHQVAARRGWRGIAFSDLERGTKRYLSSGAWDGAHLEWRDGLTWAAAAQQHAAAGRAIA